MGSNEWKFPNIKKYGVPVILITGVTHKSYGFR